MRILELPKAVSISYIFRAFLCSTFQRVACLI
jgi:hypothetical protein